MTPCGLLISGCYLYVKSPADLNHDQKVWESVLEGINIHRQKLGLASLRGEGKTK